ncbi:hypothetical protein H5410_042131 [Solanum commersonii]|uniref:Uncharacterized protein n=1 Tax=Solanum commersonii TaxID=4109 RepID=A0A9J5XTW3_SOLCO|nr:hypothetical protein H5410_042131 [Solanum commersonii]
MLCWPFFADQQTNCWFSCNRWGVGIEIDSDVKREVIEEVVRELMIGENGKEMKENALKWKNLAETAITSPTGSSYMNFDKLDREVLLPKASSFLPVDHQSADGNDLLIVMHNVVIIQYTVRPINFLQLVL